MNIIEWLLSEKIATHWKQAQNIIRGLRLDELYGVSDYEGIKERAQLYRDWRNSQIFPKADTASCFQKAIKGEAVPIVPLFAEAMHSEVIREESR